MSSFTITAPSKDVKLDATGCVSVPFTITNSSPKPVRGTPKLKTVGATPESWLSIEGGGTRNFSPGQSQQFIVNIVVPAGTPAGEYTFGLNISNEAIPEEDYSEGPPVRFGVVAKIPVTPPPPPSRWWIWALAAVLVIGGAVGLWWKLREPAPAPAQLLAPRLIGRAADALQDLPTTLRYQKIGDEHTGTQRPGVVAKQQPDPDAPVSSGDTVLYTVEAQAKHVGHWVAEPSQPTSVARYRISQEGTSIFVQVWEKEGRGEVDRGNVHVTVQGEALDISWGTVPVARPPAAPGGVRTEVAGPLRGRDVLVAERFTQAAHRQRLTLTSDGKLLATEGTANATFKRGTLLQFMKIHPEGMLLRIREP